MSRDDAGSYAGDLLQSLPLFERLPAAVAAKLTRGHSYRSLETGAVVMARGERVPEISCVLGGLVKLVVSGGRHKERIIDIVGRGNCFCLASTLLDLPCPVTAVVLEAGRALTLRREAILEAAAGHPALALRILGRVSWQLLNKIREAESDSATSSAERVVRWLLSHQGTRGVSTFTLDHSKKTTAASLNVTPETFSRVLRHLRDMGLIEVSGREIRLVDPVRLASVRLSVFAGRPAIPEDGTPASEVDAVHWLEGWREGADVPHWFAGDAEGT